MEYADGGELVTYVEEQNGLSEVEARQIMKQLISALEECHGQGIIHRDLKLENVLFETKARARIKIVDFGISGVCKNTFKERNDAGTLKYMPPELLQNTYTVANPAIDVWALGVMLYVMIFQKFPFEGSTPDEIKHKIINKDFSIPDDKPASDDLIELIRGMLEKDVDDRLNLF